MAVWAYFGYSQLLSVIFGDLSAIFIKVFDPNGISDPFERLNSGIGTPKHSPSSIIIIW